MQITRLASRNKRRTDIFIDGEPAFWLYPSEILKLGLQEEMEISDAILQKITEELVLPRAREKTVELLAASDKSGTELARKLMHAGYSREIASAMCEYAREKHYIDEGGLAEQFVRGRIGKKSKRELMMLLEQKGIDTEIAEMAYERVYVEMQENEDEEKNPELVAIEKLIRKKCNDISEIGNEELNKIQTGILRKGFRYEDIQNVVKKMKKKVVSY